MKRRTKHFLWECAIVMGVLSVLLMVSIPRFLKSQRVADVKSIQNTVEAVAQALADNPLRIIELQACGKDLSSLAIQAARSRMWYSGGSPMSRILTAQERNCRQYSMKTLCEFFPSVPFPPAPDDREVNIMFYNVRRMPDMVDRVMFFSVYSNFQPLENTGKNIVNYPNIFIKLKAVDGGFAGVYSQPALYTPTNGLGSGGHVYCDSYTLRERNRDGK